MRRAALRRLAAATALTLIAPTAAATLTRHTTPGTPPPPPPPAPAPAWHPPGPLLAADRPVAAHPHILDWALLQIATGETLAEGPCVGCTNHAASTIKIWLAGDALRQAGTHPTPALLRNTTAAVTDSDNTAATSLWAIGGRRTGLWRMVHTCHLTRTLPGPSWGATLITASDLATLGVCTARGDVAGPTRTPLLLDQMRNVRAPGRFGPVDALPPGTDIAMKNGWLLVDGQWHVNCLAIVAGTWSLGIITRYPAGYGKDHGARLCAAVTRQLTPAWQVSQVQGPRAGAAGTRSFSLS